ncbi:MAG TPA: homoprotocatechuate degradation operon regulator HpaR [Devosiaceae bacterium]|jgi:homoprotocatechuate degradation regulator HpaR
MPLGYCASAAGSQGANRLEETLLPATTRRSLPMSLLRAREAVMSNFRPMLMAHDVTEQQWRVLRVLGETEAVDASELAVRASILPPSLTRIIRTLRDRKLITRSKLNEDGRRVILSITPSGMQLLEKLTPERRAIYEAIETRFGTDKLEQLLDLLDTLIRSETDAQR